MAVSLYSWTGLCFKFIFRFQHHSSSTITFIKSAVDWSERAKRLKVPVKCECGWQWCTGYLEWRHLRLTTPAFWDLSTLGSIFRKASAMCEQNTGLVWMWPEAGVYTANYSKIKNSSDVVIGTCPYYLWSCFPAEHVSPENDAVPDSVPGHQKALSETHIISLNCFCSFVCITNMIVNRNRESNTVRIS